MPKLSTFRTFPYTARLYNYTESTDSTGGINRSYNFVRVVKCDLTQGLFGRVTIVFDGSASDIMPNARLEQLRGKDGQEIYPGGIWTLQGIVPGITIFGTTEGYHGEAKLTHSTAVT